MDRGQVSINRGPLSRGGPYGGVNVDTKEYLDAFLNKFRAMTPAEICGLAGKADIIHNFKMAYCFQSDDVICCDCCSGGKMKTAMCDEGLELWKKSNAVTG